MSIGKTLWNRRIPLPDGEEIAADVILPGGDGPFPTVVTRTPYTRGRNLKERSWLKLVDHGYAYVVVDMRGRGDSSGVFRAFVNDANDAYEVIEWVAAQEWSTGKVGMVGGSYEGLSQWWAAKAKPPHLTCIVPQAVGAAKPGPRWSLDTGIPVQYWAWWMNLVMGRTLQNPGAPSWEANWEHLPLRTLAERLGTSRSAWNDYVEGKIDYLGDDYALSEDDFASLDVPILIGVGWWDDQQTMKTWEVLQDFPCAARARLLIGAWDHAGNLLPRPVLGGLDVSPSMIDPIAYIERFLAYHLKGEDNGLENEARCHVFRTGVNRWDDLHQWPHPAARHEAWYLHSAGAAQSLRGDGHLNLQPPTSDELADSFVYDPNDPGRDLQNLDVFAWSDPPLDRRFIHRRDDTLVYTSETLDEPLDVSGQAIFEGFISSEGRDTDIHFELCDVYPDGRAIVLGRPEGVRLRYRNGAEEELLEFGDVVSIRIAGTYLHHTFMPKHRLRLAIRSANFAFLARNLNTGGYWADETELAIVVNSLYHSSLHPSRVLLPVQRTPS